MKRILQLFIVSLLILAGCTWPVPSATITPTQPILTPTSVPKQVFDGRIIYSNENDIFVMNLANSQITRLTNDPEWDFDAAWSHDGSQLVFCSHRDGDEEIYVMNADGSDQTNLSKNPGGGDWSPVWSPDGRRIAFFSEREGKSGIWVMNSDGTNPVPVGTPPGVNDYPTWSPDSMQIAWNCTMGKRHPSGRGDFEICVVNADGSGLTQLTDTEGDNKYPTWSPDGSQIAFISNRNGWPTLPDYEPLGYDPEAFGDEEIFIMNVDGTDQFNLTNNPREDDSFPAWSRDGQHLIYSRYGCLTVLRLADSSQPIQLSKGNCAGTDAGTFPDWFQPVKTSSAGITSACEPAISFMDERNGQVDIFAVNVDGSGLRQLTNDAARELAMNWSPDGSQIVYRQELPGNDEIFVINADGSDPINLTQHGANDLSPDWSPDGKTIIFESIRDVNYEIYAINPAGTNLRQLTNHPLEDQHARWSPDGSNPRPLAKQPITGNFAEWRTCSKNF